MISFASHTRVFLAPGSTDMRKAIDSLSILVQDTLELNPFSCYWFVFCACRQTQINAPYWDRKGFGLWQKRVEQDRFCSLQRELPFLLEGLNVHEVYPNMAPNNATSI